MRLISGRCLMNGQGPKADGHAVRFAPTSSEGQLNRVAHADSMNLGHKMIGRMQPDLMAASCCRCWGERSGLDDVRVAGRPV